VCGSLGSESFRVSSASAIVIPDNDSMARPPTPFITPRRVVDVLFGVVIVGGYLLHSGGTPLY
jgi:hypothetical protein